MNKFTASLQCTNGGGILHHSRVSQHSDDHSNSTGRNELDEVIHGIRIAQVLPTFFFINFFDNKK